MHIAIIGYGKMGKGIEKMALEQGHQVYIVNTETPLESQLKEHTPDVAIEFTIPEAAFDNLKTCIDCGVPVVSGTTGWTDRLADLEKYASDQGGTLLYASNFSIGVNLFFELNRKLAILMNDHPNYQASIEEIHHTEKKDAPSGTAITLGKGLIKHHNEYDQWQLADDSKEMGKPQLAIKALREEGVPGTHEIAYRNEIDEISIKHTAFSRAGFISGAILAAKYVHDKKGVFTMKDVLF